MDKRARFKGGYTDNRTADFVEKLPFIMDVEIVSSDESATQFEGKCLDHFGQSSVEGIFSSRQDTSYVRFNKVYGGGEGHITYLGIPFNPRWVAEANFSSSTHLPTSYSNPKRDVFGGIYVAAPGEDVREDLEGALLTGEFNLYDIKEDEHSSVRNVLKFINDILTPIEKFVIKWHPEDYGFFEMYRQEYDSPLSETELECPDLGFIGGESRREMVSDARSRIFSVLGMKAVMERCSRLREMVTLMPDLKLANRLGIKERDQNRKEIEIAEDFCDRIIR